MRLLETDVTMNSEKQMESKPTLSRRKFLVRAGAGSLPVIMSLQSGSAWGCVDLSCTPGHASLSNSGSKVASVTANKAKSPYKRPQWSNLATIQKAFNDDFKSVLLVTLNKTLYTATRVSGSKPTTYTTTPIPKPTANSTTAEFTSWWNKVKPGSSTKLYTTGYSSPVTLDKLKSYDNSTSVKPGEYLHNLIVGGTSCNKVCPGLPGTFQDSLFNTNKYQHFTAALVGSIWERHHLYKAYYPGRELCFPSPADLIQAFKNAKNTGKLKDLESLVKLYMSPL